MHPVDAGGRFAGLRSCRSRRFPDHREGDDKPPPAAPPELAAGFKRNAAARKTFDTFPPSQQREYVDWIAEAKRDETRVRRVAQSFEWLAEGKRRNWKYESC